MFFGFKVLAYFHNVFFLIFANENFAVHGILLKIYPIYVYINVSIFKNHKM